MDQLTVEILWVGAGAALTVLIAAAVVNWMIQEARAAAHVDRGAATPDQ